MAAAATAATTTATTAAATTTTTTTATATAIARSLCLFASRLRAFQWANGITRSHRPQSCRRRRRRCGVRTVEVAVGERCMRPHRLRQRGYLRSWPLGAGGWRGTRHWHLHARRPMARDFRVWQTLGEECVDVVVVCVTRRCNGEHFCVVGRGSDHRLHGLAATSRHQTGSEAQEQDAAGEAESESESEVELGAAAGRGRGDEHRIGRGDWIVWS
mmetsp:Transcript_70382/g.165692  ORF Transcript_70382/g.165692 Transcript_70382/m.165692 type:complete len:215 (+) Transcript_70382:770-1414(+)